MAKLLPPTVGERLAQCGTQVEVWGVMPGADVTLEVNGVPQTVTVTATGHVFVLPPLAPNAKVRARQQRGADGSDFGNTANAEPVSLPPAPPHVEGTVPRCVQSLYVWGVAPGSKIDVRQGVNVAVGSSTAGREGFACVAITQPPSHAYDVQVTTCGQTSGQVHVKIDQPLSEVPKPKIVDPLFECQSVVGFQQLVPGALYEIFVTDSANVQSSLGTFVACTPTMTVNVPRTFKPGDRVKAIGSMENARWQCHVPGRMSDEVPAVHPDDRIKPVIQEVVWEHEPIIVVTNQIEGGRITLKRKNNAAATQEETLGMRPSSKNPEVAVGADLRTDNVIWVDQELCGVVKSSDPVTVKGIPAAIPRPRVRKSVWNCAEVVIVDEMIPGATAWVKQVPMGMPGPEFLIGKQKSFGSAVAVGCAPATQNGFEIVAYQEISGKFSVPSSRVPVEFREDVPPPVVVPPIKPGDTSVWCENLLIGAHVRLFNNIPGFTPIVVQIGGGTAIAEQASIPVWGTVPQSANITASQVLCREGRPSDDVPARAGQACDGPPVLDLAKWNNDDERRRCNNCYNYATDKQLDNFAQPGGGLTLADCQCGTITTKSLSDGLHKCIAGSCHPCHHKVALVMAPGQDFHWYRQGKDGMWSHKPGDSHATDLDQSNNPISNPETADRGVYTDFCGYFCVYKPDVHLSGFCPDKDT
jgi:hypothetical protein